MLPVVSLFVRRAIELHSKYIAEYFSRKAISKRRLRVPLNSAVYVTDIRCYIAWTIDVDSSNSYVRVSSEENNFTLVDRCNKTNPEPVGNLCAIIAQICLRTTEMDIPSILRNECDLFSIPRFFWRKVFSFVTRHLYSARTSCFNCRY